MASTGTEVRVRGRQPERVPEQLRQAVLVLKGVPELSADAMLAVADRLRQALRTIGIADVRIEVAAQDETSGP